MHFNLYDLKKAAHKFLTVMAKNLGAAFWAGGAVMCL